MKFLGRTFSDGDIFRLYSVSLKEVHTVKVIGDDLIFENGDRKGNVVNQYHHWKFADNIPEILLNDEPIKLELK